MNYAIISTINKVFQGDGTDWRLRSEVVDGIRQDLSLSSEATDLVLNQLCGEHYLYPVVIYLPNDERDGLLTQQAFKRGAKLGPRVFGQRTGIL